MKKIILILFIASLIFLAGCSSGQTQNNQDNSQINQKPICIDCAAPNPGCKYVLEPGEDSCKTCGKLVCENKEQPTINMQVKEFTVEADDLGLYPDGGTLTVNKNDKVKITFKVRNDKVYYGGLDFRSNVFNTGKVLPGATKTVEFNAENTFTYTSYWPASNREKATGTINVI